MQVPNACERIVLASASPRRREILALLAIPFEVIPAEGVDEEAVGAPAEAAARALALEKGRSVLSRLEGLAAGKARPEDRSTGQARLRVLAADTIVAIGSARGEELLGKPRDAEDARRMLEALSGREHAVWTALALLEPGAEPRVEVERSEVLFRELSRAEITEYISSGEPFGKAGGYAIQGLGRSLVAGFRGCYYNVVGLPLVRAARMLGLPAPDCRCGAHPLQRGAPGCQDG